MDMTLSGNICVDASYLFNAEKTEHAEMIYVHTQEGEKKGFLYSVPTCIINLSNKV